MSDRTEGESLITGVGDEVLCVIIILVLFLLMVFYAIYLYYRNWDLRRREVVVEHLHIPQIYNTDETCTICLNVQTFSVKLNCGHIFCGLCLRNFFRHNNRNFVHCPICRRRAVILVSNFTQDEHQAGEYQLVRTRNEVNAFVREYNNIFMRQFRSFGEYVMDFPNLLRELRDDFFTVNGLLRYRTRVRIMIMVVASAIYMLTPTESFPEIVFTILGLIDYFVTGFLVLIYITILYRNIRN